LGLRTEMPSRLAPFLFVQVLVDQTLWVVDRGRLPAPYVLAGLACVAAALGLMSAVEGTRRAPYPPGRRQGVSSAGTAG
jgi:hypothetical protein